MESKYTKTTASNYVPRESPFIEQLICINRITKVTKGGRRFRFLAITVVGDSKGRVGLGKAKANDVADAIKKSFNFAKNRLFTLPFALTATVPHDIIGRCGATKVLIKTAPVGKGIVAGGTVQVVLKLIGFKDVYAKILGSSNKINCIRATLDGLSQMKSREFIQHLKQKPSVVKSANDDGLLLSITPLDQPSMIIDAITKEIT